MISFERSTQYVNVFDSLILQYPIKIMIINDSNKFLNQLKLIWRYLEAMELIAGLVEGDLGALIWRNLIVFFGIVFMRHH